MSLRIWTDSASEVKIRERWGCYRGHKEAPVGASGQLEEGLLREQLLVCHREYFPPAVLIVTASLMSHI
jgi:hypothetical protein